MTTKKPVKNEPEQTLTIKLNYQHIVWALAALNIITLFLWKPWSTSVADARTISVTGEATVEAEPDEFQFSPYWRIDSDTQDAAIEEAADKAEEVIDGLRDLDVADKDIKLSSNSYDNWWYDDDEKTHHSTVNITIKAEDKETAQEIQDFLVTTSPEGQVTPWPSFSEEKTKELEKVARAEAIEDARAKAEQSATELGNKVGKVISVSENDWGGGIFYAEAAVSDLAVEESATRSSFEILPGENELTMNVTVVFEIK